MFVPSEIIVVRSVLEDPVTRRVLAGCPGVPVRIVESNCPAEITRASRILCQAKTLADRIDAGKRVLALVSTPPAVELFEMPDPRVGCPHFLKLVLAGNGCPHRCAWCFLRATYRGLAPYLAVHVPMDDVLHRLRRHLRRARTPLILNIGELQDGLALEHLTGGLQRLIPFFAESENGFLFCLTKCDTDEPILGLPHRGHTILAWSVNAHEVSAAFEIGAPSFDQRLQAAHRAQAAGYRIRLRLDPVVPVPHWQHLYADAIRRIFAEITPELITIGTLRFEETFYKNRRALLGKGPTATHLLAEMEKMMPMLPPMMVPGGARRKDGSPKAKLSTGKHSYRPSIRIEIFRFVISEIRKHFDGPVALCKETIDVWQAVGLDPRRCACVCQYEEANLLRQIDAQLPGAHMAHGTAVQPRTRSS